MSSSAISSSHPLLTRAEVAAMLNIKVNTLAKWQMDGRGPRQVKMSPRVVRYRREDVEQFLDRSAVCTAGSSN